MATRGTIAVLLESGAVKQIYSHWDNYLECNGKFLTEEYDSYESAVELIGRGPVSSLLDYEWYGEKDDVAVYNNLQDYIDNAYFEEYNYIYIDYGWFLYDPEQKNFRHGTVFSSVKKLLEDAEIDAYS